MYIYPIWDLEFHTEITCYNTYILWLFSTLSEIPLFHVLNARITFGNIFGVDSPAPGVETVAAQGEEQLDCCVVQESCFDAPSSYSVVGKLCNDKHVINMNELMPLFLLLQELLLFHRDFCKYWIMLIF